MYAFSIILYVQAAIIIILHVHVSTNFFTVSIQPSVEWASTEESLSHQSYTAEKKTAQEILEFVKDETKIDFKFADSECHGNTFVAQGLAEVVEVNATLISQELLIQLVKQIKSQLKVK